MKPITVKVEMYDWKVTIWTVTHKTKARLVKKLIAKKLNCSLREFSSQLDAQVGNYKDGGCHYYNTDNGASIVIIYPTTSFKKFCSILAHELQHVTDRICNHHSLDCLESRAYISGYLASQIYPRFYRRRANKLETI
jgi:hypothetical protein